MKYIIWNNQDYGPYDVQTIANYVNSGQILLCDQARDVDTGEINSVKKFLNREHIKTKVAHKGSILQQLKDIGGELIFPKGTIFSPKWMRDRALIILALVGMFPSVLMFIPLSSWGTFYCISLYFSIIWGLFFYYIFKTPQVSIKTTVTIFFLEQLFVFVAWDIFGLPNLNLFYKLLDKSFPLSAVGYILGVGITEELAKMLPLLIITARAKEPQIPQTLVFYGLMSGIAFGVFEGVEYQLGMNSTLDYTNSFFHNIARLTSLPFMHSIWCGIAGYFIAFAKLYPKYRLSLYTLALFVPAILHGLYDTLVGQNFILAIAAIGISFIGVIMLNTYLKQGVNYQSKLRS